MSGHTPGVTFANPFRPGAGHMPPYLAGRQEETAEFLRLLKQDVILENLVLTGLRGVGKTVLLDTWTPLAIQHGWAWVGTDLSESVSLTEHRLAQRFFADLAVVTSSVVLQREEVRGIGFRPPRQRIEHRLDYDTMMETYQHTPGLAADKLKAVLEFVWQCLKREGRRGLIFAYDEAQNLADHAAKDEYPLSLMLDVFQSIQKKGIPFMLLLAGLPTLFPKLVEARTFAKRMFQVVLVDRLDEKDSRDAILKPIQDTGWRKRLRDAMVANIVEQSGGYPYFIQFLCKEIFDYLLQIPRGLLASAKGIRIEDPSLGAFVRKLDNSFFAGRWARATDRQRELLTVVAHLEDCENEFTVHEVAEKSRQLLNKPFGPSQITQMLAKLSALGLVYKNRHGRYSFAVPLLGRFILRQEGEESTR